MSKLIAPRRVKAPREPGVELLAIVVGVFGYGNQPHGSRILIAGGGEIGQSARNGDVDDNNRTA